MREAELDRACGIEPGALIHLLADWSPAFPGFHIYCPSRRQMAPALRAFIDFATGSAKAR